MTDSEDPTFIEGRCHPNKSALQFYVPSEVATDSQFAFEPRDEYRGMTIPGTEAVILWPKDRMPSFPVEVDDCPDELVPWPIAENSPETP